MQNFRVVNVVTVGVMGMLLAGCVSASVANATCGSTAVVVPQFDRLDANKDQVLDAQELMVNIPRSLHSHLRCGSVKSIFDTDGVGYSKFEYQKWMERASVLTACSKNSEKMRQKLISEHVLCTPVKTTVILR